MANNLAASFPDIWAKEMQEVFYKENVSMKIADLSFKSTMKYGDVLKRPVRGALTAQTYTPGTAITIDSLTDGDEYLTIDKKFATGFYVDEFESIQSMYDTAMLYGKDAGELLSNMIDAYTLGEVVNSASYVDGGDVGGTAGQGIVLASTNVIQVLASVKFKMKKLNVTGKDIFGVISPEFENIITQYLEAKETPMGDRIGENGYIGSYYGIKFYVSNQLTSTAVLTAASDLTANDTVTIAGQVFTFVASIGTTAGNVLAGANIDASRANLATLINAPGTTTSTGVALTGSALRLFQNQISAVNDNTADTLTVTAKGVGVLDVAEALTPAGDVRTSTLQLQRCLFGMSGNPVLVVQRSPSVAVRPVQDKLGSNYLNGVLFGVKTFTDNSKKMVDVRLNCSTYNA